MRFLSALILVLGVASGMGVPPAEQPRIDLQANPPNIAVPFQQAEYSVPFNLVMTIHNISTRQIYSLYDSWMPIVVFEDGKVVTMHREAEMQVRPTRLDVLNIAGGTAARTKILADVKSIQQKPMIIFYDGHGGAWIIDPVQPGKYWICIRYYVDKKGLAFEKVERSLKWTKDEYWEGLLMSDWTTLEVLGK